MRPRNTIIALILFALIGGYAFIMARYSVPEEHRKLINLKPEQMAEIELKSADRDILIRREKGKPWVLVKPIGSDADQFQCNNLAHAISETELVRTVEEKPTNLEPFALAKPTTVVTVKTFDGKALPSIEIGKNAPVGFNAYVKMSNSPAVLLTSSVFPTGMNKTVNDLRNKDLVTFKMDDVQKLILTRDNGETIEVDRDGAGWKVVKPAAYAADEAVVRQVLNTLVSARVADFIADAPASVAQYGLEKPHLTATAMLKNGGQQSVLFGFKQTEQGKGGIYVRRGERASVYAVPAYVMTSANKSILELRDKTALKFEPSAVESVAIKTKDGNFTLKRAAGGKWDVIEGGQTSPADVAVVERLLSELKGLKGASIIADPMPNAAPFGLDNPAVEITLTGKDGKQIGDLKAAMLSIKPSSPPLPGESPKPRIEHYLSTGASKAVYTLSDYYYSQLDNPASIYKARTQPTPAPK
ncbi:MAG: DUF4340 domain-containing protein [Candidatus Binatus sp.]|uniref:DUF4340 domain-containing protein n=1 Tax=Candidatus Binatus sp. TaxID=2811406 RepID=UPI0027261F27|nr:DUF4340 domain-containing protein [Candidatus Binatus sp.]MDO8433328.1 DUF4340 domain-containing protein [Candidatus Binatus sp.]